MTLFIAFVPRFGCGNEGRPASFPRRPTRFTLTGRASTSTRIGGSYVLSAVDRRDLFSDGDDKVKLCHDRNPGCFEFYAGNNSERRRVTQRGIRSAPFISRVSLWSHKLCAWCCLDGWVRIRKEKGAAPMARA